MRVDGDKLRVGVIGVGALGQHHARVYAELGEATLVGVYDRDPRRAQEVAQRHGCRVFDDAEALAREVDAVSVAVPTEAHHAIAGALLDAGRHVLVEKPITASLEQALDLIARAAARDLRLQVGHVERFNPALDILRGAVDGPRFVEAHRLGAFSPRSLDVDVVLDLMIHDLDIVLWLDGSDPVQVDAVGVPVLTPRVDIANARLRFASGLIANLTASRVSAERVRKFRVFAPRTYVSVDLAAREARVYRLSEALGPDNRPDIDVQTTKGQQEEPLRRQLASFLHAVRTGGRPVVAGEDGRRALGLALTVVDRMADYN
jgi:predicted dehydrogenase